MINLIFSLLFLNASTVLLEVTEFLVAMFISFCPIFTRATIIGSVIATENIYEIRHIYDLIN